MSDSDDGIAERLGVTLDSLRVGIIALDGQGRVEFLNAEASRILDLSRRASAGKPLAESLGDRHPVVSILMETLETGREVSRNACEIQQRRDARRLVVDLSASPIAAGHDIEGAALTLHDRTIGRELEDIVDQHARSELYAQLAAGIAHEIRNPLGGIRGSAELLANKLSDDLQRYPNLIVEQTDRIRRLLDDFAELTRGGDLRLQPTNIHEILDKMLLLQRQSQTLSKIEVHREYDPSIPKLELDSDRITQVFLNLVRNAGQAMSDGGELTLRTRVETLYQLSARSRKPLRMVRIDVEDSGAGIAPEDLPHIFTPFFTRREGGTGLGLALTQHWVVKHDGLIQVTPRQQGGTRVRVLLPVSGQP